MPKHKPHRLLVPCLTIYSIFWLALPSGSLAFTITSPREDAQLRPGQEVTVSVAIGKEINISQVRYYWYRQDEEPVVSQQAQSVLVVSSTSAVPFGGALRVPLNAVGAMRLLAVGDVTRGRLGGHEEFDEILVQVNPPAELLSIEFSVEKPWRLDTIGKVLEVPVVGQFADGVLRRLEGPSAGSSYRSSDERVVQAFQSGVMRVIGNGKATLTVANRGKEGQVDVLVSGDQEPNRAPIARVTSDLTVKAGATVTLDGIQSSDPDGDPLRYEWRQSRGNKVTLMNIDQPKAIFVAPKVSIKRLLRFELRVTDMNGPDTVKGADSFRSVVNVWVEP